MLENTNRALAREGDVISTGPFTGLKHKAYPVIYADPAWAYVVRSAKGQGRSAERHYRTMSLDDIKALPVSDLAKPDCHLFLWITGPFLAAGAHLEVMKAWGFKPSSMAFVWCKTNDHETIERAQSWDDVFFNGMGFTTRQNAEYVVLGRRGNPKRGCTTTRQIVVSRRREHSRKPDIVRKRIEEYVGAPGVELFARSTGPSWDFWGNEVGLFDSDD
jgi:N6-adenosine-specific RNA methylase IME4